MTTSRSVLLSGPLYLSYHPAAHITPDQSAHPVYGRRSLPQFDFGYGVPPVVPDYTGALREPLKTAVLNSSSTNWHQQVQRPKGIP